MTPPRPSLPDGRPLGAHLPLGHGMVKAVERARTIGAEALQVFIDNPTAWKRRADPPAELGSFREHLARAAIDLVVVHASYLVNLAGPDPELHERSIELLAAELAAAPSFGARLVNVHVGSHKGAGAAVGVARVADGLARVLGTGPASGAAAAPLLVLENSAGGGGGLGATLEELEAIFEAAAARGVPTERLALCLDTAHCWGAGIDVATPEAADALVDGVAARLGLDRLVLVHLNDSKAAFGSRHDRHQHLGAGEMGAATGLGRLLAHPALAHVTFILETPGMDEGYDAVNLERARRLAAGLSLEPLPPEALDMRGARARTPAA